MFRGQKMFGALVLFFCLILSVPASAAVTKEEIPPQLQSWVPWVLHNLEEKTCAFPYNDGSQNICTWPSRLELSITEHKGKFSQEWLLQIEDWVTLPGNFRHWPRAVKDNETRLAVIERNGRPTVFLKPGSHTLTGSFLWDKQPESLAIPTNTGLLSLTLQGKTVDFPNVDGTGNLWLSGSEGDGTTPQDDRLELKVYRHLLDSIPLTMTTRIDLDVTGKSREVLLGWPMSAEFIPLSLLSPLPARLEKDGRLLVQVRPGHWTITLAARRQGLTTELAIGEITEPWPQEEVWVFKAQNDLRMVNVEGPEPIDPNQTTLPGEWRNLPAYKMGRADTMRLVEKKRGDPEPAPDRLSLHRTLWLDEDGGAFTIKDQITGTMSQEWRLTMNLPAILGRVSMNGQDQFITRLSGESLPGVEVRHGNLDLTAESRIVRLDDLPTVGWAHNFQKMEGQLNLPPGWRLFDASGVDSIPTWLKNWTLLDLFLVLIITLSVAKIWSVGPGILALLTMVLLYHEPGAPRWIWPNLLAAAALLKVLPSGRVATAAAFYRNLMLVILLIIAIPFMVLQIRQGIYPQLEFNWNLANPFAGRQQVMSLPPASAPIPQEYDELQSMEEAVDAVREMKMADEPMRREKRLLSKVAMSSGGYYQEKRAAALEQIDSKAMIQTGPGLPQWQWRSLPMSWNGPVEAGQKITLYLIPPWANTMLCFLRVILLAGLILVFFNLRYSKHQGFRIDLTVNRAAPLLLIAALLGGFTAQARAADLPTPELLGELQERLLEPAECLPDCAALQGLTITLADRELTADLYLHTYEEIAVPLPSTGGRAVTEVLSDTKPAQGLFRDHNGVLWLKVGPGRHQIKIREALPDRQTVDYTLPLKAMWVQVKAKDWTVDGIHENGEADSQLQFRRLAGQEMGKSVIEPGALPPFVRVQRILHLGLDWTIETRVERVSPTGTPVILQLPLLNGESVTSGHIRVENSKALINMEPQQRLITYNSVFAKEFKVTITAPESTDWAEVWQLDVSPVWHVITEGIPPIHHQDNSGNWQPEWQPWPGESITLTVIRPEGVDGPTLTIDNTSIDQTPGLRSTETVLAFTARSSRGGQHTLTLPDGAELQSVAIDNRTQPIRQQGRAITIPIVPGSQNISLNWLTPMTPSFHYLTQQINLGVESVNTNINLHMGRDRWILMAGGPRLGPAVLFWGELLVILLLGLALGRVKITPLKSHQWILLGLGLSQMNIEIAAVVVAWLLCLGLRREKGSRLGDQAFDFMQIGLVILTVAAGLALIMAVKSGLLGYPDMQIAGNGSSAYELKWYQDRAGETLPQAWVISVPLMVYRLAMLAWALWLAFALLKWLRWGWECFSNDGLWRQMKLRKEKKAAGTEELPEELPELTPSSEEG